jgi:nitroreductase
MKSILKLYMYLLSFKNKILPRYFVAHPFLSSLYYVVFSSDFRREQHAVLTGKVKHLKELKQDKANIYTLVRNVHRIEKGLLMRPRRDVFALDFIGETIDAFENVWTKEKCTSDMQYKWFHDVLTHYFETSGKHKTIQSLYERFNKVVKEGVAGHAETKLIPYCRLDADRPNISYDDFYKLTRHRRSVRWFLDKPVPHDLVDKAILAANQSPSACNRQPFEYRIIDDKQMLKTVANLPRGVKGYVDGLQMMIVVVGNLDAYFDERDRHVIYIDASLANMTLMLALETLGLSSCAINWPDVEVLEKEMERFLKLKKYQRPLMCIAVGYPDPEGKVAFSEKRNLENIRKYN